MAEGMGRQLAFTSDKSEGNQEWLFDILTASG